MRNLRADTAWLEPASFCVSGIWAVGGWVGKHKRVRGGVTAVAACAMEFFAAGSQIALTWHTLAPNTPRPAQQLAKRCGAA